MMDEIIVECNIKEMEKKKFEEYHKAGVWALWANDSEGKKVCLEVGKTINIYNEISSALYILSTEDDLKCKQCADTHNANRRNNEYNAEFKIHNCKSCEYVSNLRKKSWKRNPRYIDKYKDMLLHYQDLQFVLVAMDNTMEDDYIRSQREKEYAETNKALYWQS